MTIHTPTVQYDIRENVTNMPIKKPTGHIGL